MSRYIPDWRSLMLNFKKICRNFSNGKKIGRKGSNYMAHLYLPTVFRKWPEAATVSDLAIEMTSCHTKVVIFKPLGSKSSLKCIFWLLAHLVCHQDHFRFNNSFIFTTNILTSKMQSHCLSRNGMEDTSSKFTRSRINRRKWIHFVTLGPSLNPTLKL